MVPAVPLFLLKNQPLRTVDVAMNCFPMITGDSVSAYFVGFRHCCSGASIQSVGHCLAPYDSSLKIRGLCFFPFCAFVYGFVCRLAD